MKKILAAITEDSLDRAKRHVARELEDHGFWTDRVQQTDVYLTPLSITAYGWQYYRGSGDIAIPRVNGHRMLTKSLGFPKGYTLRDVLRHEYGHAVAHHHRGKIRSRKFSNAFWSSHDCKDERPWEYEEDLFVSPYAATSPSEDFAETFMFFLRHRGDLPSRFQNKYLRPKWDFILELGRDLESDKKEKITYDKVSFRR